MDKKEKKITLLLICLLGSLGCRAEKTSFSQLIETFGDNGEYARMDSVYQLAVRHPDYRNDLFLALTLTSPTVLISMPKEITLRHRPYSAKP